MDKRLKAAVAGLAFLAGCEIGIALQLIKMIHNYTIKEAAGKESVEGANSREEAEITDEPAAEEALTSPKSADAVEENADEPVSDDDASPDLGDAQAAFAD